MSAFVRIKPPGQQQCSTEEELRSYTGGVSFNGDTQSIQTTRSDEKAWRALQGDLLSISRNLYYAK